MNLKRSYGQVAWTGLLAIGLIAVWPVIFYHRIKRLLVR